jgi:hypothetical protein
MMSALVVLGAATLLENPSLRKSAKLFETHLFQFLRLDFPLPVRCRNSTKAAFAINTNMNVVNPSVTKPSNRYFISASFNMNATCLSIISAFSGIT